MKKIDTSKLPQVAPEFDVQQMLDYGCHFGHAIKRWHPKMAEWIYAEKNGIHLFDLFKTAQQLKHVYNYFYDLGKQNKQVIILGTKRHAKEVVQQAAQASGMMYIASRWLGGFLTNWEQINRSLKRMIEIEQGLESGAYVNYTKYERVQLDKERARLERFFGGIRNLKDKPDAIFVVDPKKEDNAVEEANKMGVPVVALADTDADPSKLSLLVPANDDSKRSIELMVTTVCQAYAAGKKAK